MYLYFPRSKPPTSCKRSWCQLSSPRLDGLPWKTYSLVSRGRCMWHLLWSEAIFFRSFANTRFIFNPLTHFSMWMSLPQSLVRTCAVSVRIRFQVGNIFQLFGNIFTLSMKTLIRRIKTEVLLSHIKARPRSFAFVQRDTSFSPCSRYPPSCGGHPQVKEFFHGNWKEGDGPERPEDE